MLDALDRVVGIDPQACERTIFNLKKWVAEFIRNPIVTPDIPCLRQVFESRLPDAEARVCSTCLRL